MAKWSKNHANQESYFFYQQKDLIYVIFPFVPKTLRLHEISDNFIRRQTGFYQKVS